jgi:hypothetical protein
MPDVQRTTQVKDPAIIQEINMELIKVTKDGALHFKLSDGRIGATYPSGYVRVSTKSVGYRYNRVLMYQINRQRKDWYDPKSQWGYNTVRELIPNHADRVRRLLDFNEENCK